MSENEKTTAVSNETFSAYDKKVHRWGRLSTTLALVFMYLPVVVVCLVYSVPIEWAAVGTGGWPIFIRRMADPWSWASAWRK